MAVLRRTRDLNQVKDLAKNVFSDCYECLDYANGVWWVLWENGRPAGFCGIKRDYRWRGSWHMIAAGILPSARGAGLQKRMIEARVRYAAAHRGRDVMTYTVNNPPSIKNLIRCGFLPFVPANQYAGRWAIYWHRKI